MQTKIILWKRNAIKEIRNCKILNNLLLINIYPKFINSGLIGSINMGKNTQKICKWKKKESNENK